MATRKGSSRNSSETSIKPDVFQTSFLQPMPIGPPDTSALTAMPEYGKKSSDQLVQDDAHESRWKPLLGTPSKPAIPENILVPDPSPTHTFSDADSSNVIPSTPGSFIHERRQGEYVPRPPVWRIGDSDGGLPCFIGNSKALPVKDYENEGADPFQKWDSCKLDQEPSEFSFLSSRWGGMKYSQVLYEEQMSKMGNVFVDSPLLVNMVQLSESQNDSPDTLRQSNESGENIQRKQMHNTGDSPEEPANNLPSSVETKNTSDLRSTADRYSTKSQISDVKFVRHSRVPTAEQFGSTVGPSTANTNPSLAQSRDESHTSDSNTSTETSSQGEEQKIIKSHILVNQSVIFAHTEPPESENQDSLEYYVDLRVDVSSKRDDMKRIVFDIPEPDRMSQIGPLHLQLGSKEDSVLPDSADAAENKIVVGSQVVYVGCTKPSDSEDQESLSSNLLFLGQYFVARIFGDRWALCIKLGKGLEQSTTEHRSILKLKRFSVPEVLTGDGPGEAPSYMVKTNDKILVYAPLCAFTLSSNFGAFRLQAAMERLDSEKATFQGGWIRAAPRQSSQIFEHDAKQSRRTRIPQKVFHQYVDFCNASDASSAALEAGGSHIRDAESSQMGLDGQSPRKPINTVTKRMRDAWIARNRLSRLGDDHKHAEYSPENLEADDVEKVNSLRSHLISMGLPSKARPEGSRPKKFPVYETIETLNPLSGPVPPPPEPKRKPPQPPEGELQGPSDQTKPEGGDARNKGKKSLPRKFAEYWKHPKAEPGESSNVDDDTSKPHSKSLTRRLAQRWRHPRPDDSKDEEDPSNKPKDDGKAKSKRSVGRAIAEYWKPPPPPRRPTSSNDERITRAQLLRYRAQQEAYRRAEFESQARADFLFQVDEMNGTLTTAVPSEASSPVIAASDPEGPSSSHGHASGSTDADAAQGSTDAAENSTNDSAGGGLTAGSQAEQGQEPRQREGDGG